MKQTIDIVITTYNGQNLLKKHLPEVIKHSGKINQIIVVDDGGDDDTSNFIQEFFPSVIYVKNSKNLGFPKSSNRGVSLSEADFVVLLNNDVSPQKEYLTSALKYFQDPQVFAVTFNEIHSSWPQVSWKDGKLHFTQGEDKTEPRFSAWASGGSAVFRKSMWRSLGGFNEIYSPGYWEDIDLGWRAWKSGYKIIWDPKSKVDHQHESTFRKLNPGYIDLIKQRNELLFTWLNITDSNLKKSHLNFLLIHCLKHPGYLKVIAKAIVSYKKASKQYKINDHQVLKLVNSKI